MLPWSPEDSLTPEALYQFPPVRLLTHLVTFPTGSENWQLVPKEKSVLPAQKLMVYLNGCLPKELIHQANYLVKMAKLVE